ncbi:MAG: TetR/AcrR family transcriptional regulator [Thermodesulfobacteriota bacterium]
MPPIPELSEIRRSQILQAALATIATMGCAAATMDDIAKAAGMSKGGLVHYFKSKHELFISTFREFFERVFERCRVSEAQYEHPMDKLLGFELLFDANDSDVRDGYPILFDFMAIAVHDTEFRAIFDEWVQNWVTLLSSAIRQGIEQGIFRELDPDPMARTISAVYQGIATRWYLAPEAHSYEWAINSYRAAIEGLMRPYRLDQP